MPGQFDWYYAALKGNKIDWERGSPPSGYFRRDYTHVFPGEPGKKTSERRSEAIAIWRQDEDGQFSDTGEYKCWRSSDFRTPTDVDFIEELFAQVHANAVPHDEFLAFRETGEWPADKAREVKVDEPPGIGHNSGEPESDLAKATAAIENLKEQFSDWFKAIGGKINSDAEADKAANFSAEFAKYEKRAATLHKQEKAPHLEAGRAVDAAWKPLIKAADDAKRKAKDVITPHLNAKAAAERKRAQEDADRLAKEAAALAEKEAEEGFVEPTPQPVAPEPTKVSAGTIGKVSLRTFKSTEISDVKACAGYFASFTNPPTELVEVLKKLARKSLDAGHDVPGAKLIEEQRAA